MFYRSDMVSEPRYGNLPVFTRLLDKVHPGLGSDRGFDIDRKNKEIQLLAAQTKSLEKIARYKVREYKETRILQETASQYSPAPIQQIPSYTPENLAQDINDSLWAYARSMEMDNKLTREVITEIGADLHRDLVTIDKTVKTIVQGVFETNQSIQKVDESIGTLTNATNLQTGHIAEQTDYLVQQTNIIQAEDSKTRNQLEGIFPTPLSLPTLESLTDISETEIISLGLRNILSAEVFYKFLKNLGSWKQKIISHIIKYDDIGHDPIFEKDLDSSEKAFLNDLRTESKTDLRPATLGYLARHGFLDRFVQDEAGKHIKEVRSDIYGLNQNVQDVISGLQEVTSTIIWTESRVRETLETIYTGIQDQTKNWYAHRKNERLEAEAIPLIKIGEYNDALEALDDARKLNRFDPRTFLYKGIVFMLINDSKSAEEELKKALIRAQHMKAPKRVRQEVVSEICTYLGRLKHKLAQRALENSKKNLFEEEISEASKNAKIALDNSLESPEKSFDLARYLCVSNEYEESLSVIRKLLFDNPETLKTLLEESDFQPISREIIKTNEETIKINKKIIEKKGSKESIKEIWEKNPTNIENMFNWLKILYSEKKYKEIDYALKASIYIDSDFPELLQKLSNFQELGKLITDKILIFYCFKSWVTEPKYIEFCLEILNISIKKNESLSSKGDVIKILERILIKNKMEEFSKSLLILNGKIIPKAFLMDYS